MLKIKKFKVTEDMKPFDFLLEFFKQLPATYYEGGSLQCRQGKLRSYGDLFKVFKYYYPTHAEYYFDKTLSKLIRYGYVNAVYCGDVQKVTFYPLPPCGYTWYAGYGGIFIAAINRIFLHSHELLSSYYGYDLERERYKKAVTPLLAKLNVVIPKATSK